MLAFLELTPRFKKLKRRASLEFCVYLDMSQIGIDCFTKRCLLSLSVCSGKAIMGFLFFQLNQTYFNTDV